MLRRAPSVGAEYSWCAGSACTESLGSESGDVGCDDQFFPPVPAPAGGGGPDAAEADADDVAALCEARAGEPGLEATVAVAPEKRRRRGGSFPPPMPRASAALVLHAQRRGGRLILTEVRAEEVERRVVFRAERDGGRLRLRFVNADDADDPERGGDGPEEGGSGSAVQHGGGGGGGELCQVAAAGHRGGVEVGAVVMGTI